VELLKKEQNLKVRKNKLVKNENRSDAENETLESIDSETELLPKQSRRRDRIGQGGQGTQGSRRPTRFSKQVVNWTGKTLLPRTCPQPTKELPVGKKLFTERGCLRAIPRRHDQEGGGCPGSRQQAKFGPNLSRIAAKLAPEFGDTKDSASGWCSGCSIRTSTIRHGMPITQLEVRESRRYRRLAASQKVTIGTRRTPPLPRPKSWYSWPASTCPRRRA